MKTILASAILVAFLTTHNAQASDSREQLALGGVALAGAVAGGPIGLIVGVTLADHYVGQRHDKADALARAERLDAELETAGQRLAAERRSSAELRANLDALRSDNALLAEDRKQLGELQFDIHFRTGDATPGDSDRARLVRLAEFLNRYGELRIELHGHADARGSDALNESLAMQRAREVAAILAGLGVDEARIATFGFGEQQATAAGGDVDGLAYDRRVRVVLDAGAPSLPRSADRRGDAVAQPGTNAAAAGQAERAKTLRLVVNDRSSGAPADVEDRDTAVLRHEP